MSLYLKKILKGYNSLLKTHPAITKPLTGAFFTGVGDFIAQKFIEKQKDYDRERTIRFVLVALFLISPSTRYWIDIILPKLVKEKNSKNLNIFAVKKVITDEVIYAPIITALAVGANMYRVVLG